MFGRTISLFLLLSFTAHAQILQGVLSSNSSGITLGPLIYDYTVSTASCSPTCTVSTPASTVAGDFLEVIYGSHHGTAIKISSVSGDDTGGGVHAWVANGACTSNSTATTAAIDIAYNLSASTSGSVSLTITLSATDSTNANGPFIVVMRYKGGGASPTYALDGSCQSTSNGASSNPNVLPSITTTGTADLITAVSITTNTSNYGYWAGSPITGTGWNTPDPLLLFNVLNFPNRAPLIVDARSVAAGTYQASVSDYDNIGAPLVATAAPFNASELAFSGFQSTGCVDEDFLGFEGGTNNTALTTTTLSNSLFGLAVPFSNGGGAQFSIVGAPKASTASKIALLNSVTLCGGGATKSGAGSLGMEVDGTGANSQNYVKYSLSFSGITQNPPGYTTATLSTKYNDNLAFNDTSSLFVLEMRDVQGNQIVGVHSQNGGANRQFQIGSGGTVTYNTGTSSCGTFGTNGCTLVLTYVAGNGSVGATQTLSVYDSTGALLGTATMTGAATSYPVNEFDVGQIDNTTITNGKALYWDSVTFAPGTTVTY